MASGNYKIYALIMMIVLMGISWVGPEGLWAGFVKAQVNYSVYPPMRGQQPAIPAGPATPHSQPTSFRQILADSPPTAAKRHMTVSPDDRLNVLPAFSRIISEIYGEMEPQADGF